MPSFKKTAPSESLKARRTQKARPNFYTGYVGREDWTCRAMSSDKLNLQFSWTLAQEYSWFKLCALFFMGYIAPRLAKSGTQAFFGFTGIGEFIAVTFAGLHATSSV
jgi:hypothetical protein